MAEAQMAALLDSMGRRNNRKLPNMVCPNCGADFKPHRAASKYCSRKCAWANNGGHNAKPEVWWVNQKGYIEGHVVEGGIRKRVKQHRRVAEGMLGRELLPHEDVHHKNGVKSDNRPENLEVVTHSEHSRITNYERTYRKGYKLKLSDEQRRARSERMRVMRAKATGEAQ